MHVPPMIAFSLWFLTGMFLFRMCPLRVAIVSSFLAGWAILPSADFVPTEEIFPYWILPVCLPSTTFITKATVLGVTAIAGMLLFHRVEIRKLKLRAMDFAFLLLSLAPIFSSIANHLSPLNAMFGAVYLFFAWLVPFYLGRFYLYDRDSLLLLAKAIALAGLVYIPICVVELFSGPQIYSRLYGYQPFQWIGAHRYFGFRPIGFLEDGNQLGIWMASAASVTLAALVLQTRMTAFKIPLKWVAFSLLAVTLMCQSVGSILALGITLLLILLCKRFPLRLTLTTLLCGILFFTSLQILHVVPWRELGENNPTARSIAKSLSQAGRRSLGWRLARDEKQASIARHKPVFGSGKWNWWQSGGIRPWDLWMLVVGMYGIVGALAVALVLLIPVILAIWRPFSPGSDDYRIVIVLIGSIIITMLDSLMNGAIILPYLLIAGALSSQRAKKNTMKINGNADSSAAIPPDQAAPVLSAYVPI
jgi:hypothetical protein